jgi:hypothetical protein
VTDDAVRDWVARRAAALAGPVAGPVPVLDFLTRLPRSPTALRRCEAALDGPAATDDRTAALGLPPASRFDARARLRTFEQLAADGRARLPDRDESSCLRSTEQRRGPRRPAERPARRRSP